MPLPHSPTGTPDPMEGHGHIPVLLDAALEALKSCPGDTVVDCTAGRGGHASKIARAIQPEGRLIFFDLDGTNLQHTSDRLKDEQLLESLAIERSFAAVGRELTQRGLVANGLLADLGFASNQMDDPTRGLSLRADGPLDMRLDPGIPVNAADLLARLGEEELRDPTAFGRGSIFGFPQ